MKWSCGNGNGVVMDTDIIVEEEPTPKCSWRIFAYWSKVFQKEIEIWSLEAVSMKGICNL